MANVSFRAPTDYEAELADIERRRAYAKALQEQGMQQPGTESVGGWAIPRSPMEYAGRAAQQVAGAYGQAKATEAQKALAARIRKEGQADVTGFMAALQGTPAGVGQPDPQEMQQAADQGTPEPQPFQTAAVPGDRQKALAIALQSQNPMVQGAGGTILSEMLKSPEKIDLGGSWGFMRNGQIVATIPKSATPDTMIKEGGLDRRFGGVSGNTAATVNAANQRHLTPSGSAQLGANTTLQTHATPSGSARLAADTARRGQDIGINPEIQAVLEGTKTSAREFAGADAKAQINLPGAAAKADQAIRLIDQMIGSKDGKVKEHPGFQSYVGATLTPGARFVEGSSTASYEALENQLKGGAFMQAFETLKGGGQITEVEGKKATEAITRMNKAQSEAEYKTAAREFQDVIKAGLDRAKKAAAGGDRRQAPRDTSRRVVVDY